MKRLSDNERAALAMHELMKRDQRRMADRQNEQLEINQLSDDDLKSLVDSAFKVTDPASEHKTAKPRTSPKSDERDEL